MRAGLHRFLLLLLLAALPYKGIAAVLMPGCAAMLAGTSSSAVEPSVALAPAGVSLPCHDAMGTPGMNGPAATAAAVPAGGDSAAMPSGDAPDTAAGDAAAEGAPCCTCGPCLAPMLATGTTAAVPGTDRAEARPPAAPVPAPHATADVPRPPPRG